jgi:hypothetical protein
MLRTLATASVIVAVALIAGWGSSFGNQVQQGADEVIALERSALDRWGRGDVGGFLSLYADEITYFDPMTDRRVDGLPAMRAWYEPFAGKFTIDRYEMVDPKSAAVRRRRCADVHRTELWASSGRHREAREALERNRGLSPH